MGPIVVHADCELAVVQYLTGISQVTAVVSQIKTQLQSHPVFPTVLISRVAGQDVWPALDEAVIAVDVYGTDKRNALQVMQTVRGALLAIGNDTVTECVLVSCVEELGPQWLPDTIPTPPVPRYTARFRVLTHT